MATLNATWRPGAALRLLLPLVLCLSAASGQGAFSPAQIMRLAVQVQPSVRAARFRLEAAEGYAAGIGAQPNPTLRLTGTVGVPIEEANSLTFPYELGARPWLRGQSAQQEAQARRNDLQSECRRVALQAGQAYYDLWETQAVLGVAHERVELAEKLAFSSRRRWEVGEISKNQYLRADLEAARARADEATARADEGVARTKVNQWLARDPEASLVLPAGGEKLPVAPPPPIELEPDAQTLAERSILLPELEALRAEQRAADLQVQLAERLGSPNLQLQLYRSTLGGGTGIEQGVALSLVFPLWDWGQNAAEYERRLGLAKAAGAAVDERLLEVTQRAAAALARYRGALARRQLLTDQVQRFVVLSGQARRAYDAGLMTLVEVFDTQNSYRLALQTYVAAEAEVQRSLLQLAWAINAPFFEDVSHEK